MRKNDNQGRVLGSKQYAYEIDEYDDMCGREFCDGHCGKAGCMGNGGKKCKGVKKGLMKNTLTVDHYEDCLRNDTTYFAKFNTLRSRKHDITGPRLLLPLQTTSGSSYPKIPNTER